MGSTITLNELFASGPMVSTVAAGSNGGTITQIATANFPSGAGVLEVASTLSAPEAGQIELQLVVTLTSALTSGSPVTSLAVTALPVGVASGDQILVTSSGHAQIFVCNLAASAASTSIFVTSQDATFSFPTGTTVTDMSLVGGWPSAVISYNSTTSTSIQGCQLISLGPSGSFTVTTGSSVSSYGFEPSLGTSLLVEYSPVIDFTSEAFLGPQPYTSINPVPGISFPRGIIEVEGTFQTKQNLSEIIGLGVVFQNAMVYKNEYGASATIEGTTGFVNVPVYIADNAGTGFPAPPTGIANVPGTAQDWAVGFYDIPIFFTENSGTFGHIQICNYYASGRLFGGSCTGLRRIGLLANDIVVDPGSSMAFQYGILIGNLESDGITLSPYAGATNNFGLVNASTTHLRPGSTVNVGASFTLSCPTQSCVNLNSTANVFSSTTAAVIPAPPQDNLVVSGDGQVVVLVNVGANTITFSSGATENLSLGEATRALAAGGALTLIYDDAFGRWVEIAFSSGGH